MSKFARMEQVDEEFESKGYLNNNKIKKKVKISRIDFERFENSQKTNNQSSIDLLMDVPMEVKVELGKTIKQVKDVLTLDVGSLVQLDSIAGDDVDILLNGQCLAKGEVIIADNKYVVRISRISKE